MDNKLFKRIVAVAASAVLLTSSAFATTLSEVSYEDGSLGFTYDPQGASKVTYLAYAATEAETFDAADVILKADGTRITLAEYNELADKTGCTKYVFGEIVAVNQLDGDEVVADGAPLSVPVNDGLLCMDASAETKVEATHIVLMSGSDVATSAATEVIALAQAPAEKFTVTFLDATGAAIGTPASVEAGTAISTLIPADPTKTGEAFVGWYTDQTLTTKLDKAGTVTADMTLYPKFVVPSIYGDANGDGKLDTTDIGQIITAMNATSPLPPFLKVGKEIPFTAAEIYGDANGDKKLDTTDIGQVITAMNATSPLPPFLKVGKNIDVVKD